TLLACHGIKRCASRGERDRPLARALGSRLTESRCECDGGGCRWEQSIDPGAEASCANRPRVAERGCLRDPDRESGRGARLRSFLRGRAWLTRARPGRWDRVPCRLFSVAFRGPPRRTATLATCSLRLPAVVADGSVVGEGDVNPIRHREKRATGAG